MHHRKQAQRLALIALIIIVLGMSHPFEQKASAAEDIQPISYNPLNLKFPIEDGEEQFIITYTGEEDAQIVQKDTTREKCLRDSGLCHVGITFPSMVRQVYRGTIEAKDADGTLLRTFDTHVIQTGKPPKVKVNKLFPWLDDGHAGSVERGDYFTLSYSFYGPRDADLIQASNYIAERGLVVRIIRPDGKRAMDDFSCTGWNCYFYYKTKVLGQHQFQLTYFGSFGKRWSRIYTFEVIEAK